MNIYLKETKELNKWKRELQKPRPKFYFIYFIVIICLAFIVDELATNVNNFLEDYVLESYFKDNFNNYTICITLCSSISILSFLYKALADKYGRKIFLVINTIGMGAGMMICFISRNLPIYVIGLLFMFFFVPCDIQSVYIVETASDKHRAFWLSFCKAFAVMSLAMIPALLSFARKSNWQNIFLVPACIGLALGIIALFFVKESEPFMRNRIAYIDGLRHQRSLKLSKQELRAKRIVDSQGGIIAGFKYIFLNRRLMWLFFVGVIFSLCSIAAINYSVIIYNGYEETGHTLTESQYNICLIIYPFVCAICNVIIGLISDKKGRKTSTVTAGAFAMIGLLFFITAVNRNWYVQLTGIALGVFMAGFLSGVDTFTLMCAEQSPTNLRSSVMSIMSISLSVGSFIGTGILLLAGFISHNKVNIGYLAMCVICPTIFIGVIILLSKMPETNNTDLSAVQFNILKEYRKKNKTNKNGVEQLELFQIEEKKKDDTSNSPTQKNDKKE